MIRYLKYIILVFGGLGLIIASFFYFQNRHDINSFFKYRTLLSYDHIQKSCTQAESKYYYPCFAVEFKNFLNEVSLTGSSIGLKMAFNFIDEDRDNTTEFNTENEKSIAYTLNYLELNSFVIESAQDNYRGIKKLYPGFIISLERFYKKSFEFSDNLIIGLEGDDGMSKIESPSTYDKQLLRFTLLKNQYFKARENAQSFIKSEQKRLEMESQKNK